MARIIPPFNLAFGAANDGEAGADLNLLMSNFRFSSAPEVGLELVDIVTNAVRRAVTGNLSESGWRDIPGIMIHRREHYIGVMGLEGASQMRGDPDYADVVRRFTEGGRTMLAPRFQRMADATS